MPRRAGNVLFVVTIGCLGWLTWEYVTTKDVTNTTAVVLMLGSGALFSAFYSMFGAEAPTSMFGIELPTGATREERVTRVRSYLLDSGVFTLAMVALSVVGYFLVGDKGAFDNAFGLPLPIAALLAALATFAIYFVVTWALGEAESRAVERRLAKLEAGI